MDLTITHKHLRNILNNLNDNHHDDLLMELKYSTLIAPAGDDVPYLEGRHIPLFTDIYEFDKFNGNHEYRPAVHEFNDYLDMMKSRLVPGFIINPDSENYMISKDILEFLLPDYIFNQEYHPFTVREIRKLKKSIRNADLNEFISDRSNLWDLEELTAKLDDSLLLTLLLSDTKCEDEDGVISIFHMIPKCIHVIGDKKYLLLFSREISSDFLSDEVYAYSQIVNFPLLVREVLNNDLDGFILNMDEENITVPRQSLRDFMKDFRCPCLDDYSMYAFTIPEAE